MTRRENEKYPIVFEVLERNGNDFKAHWAGSRNKREISGKIENGVINWKAANVKVLKGHEGQDHEGTIVGETITLKYSGIASADGRPVSGTVILRLEKK